MVIELEDKKRKNKQKEKGQQARKYLLLPEVWPSSCMTFVSHLSLDHL